MDDIIKKMTKQLSENYYSNGSLINEADEFSSGTEKQPLENNGQIKIFQTNDEIVKGYITDIHSQVGSVHISFGDLKYTPSQKKVHWTGTVAGVEWTVLYSEKTSGFYFTADNEEMSVDESLSFHKLNLYFHTVWFSAIRDAILKNELTK